MAAHAADDPPYHRYREAADDERRPGAFEWLADLNPEVWRRGDGEEPNIARIAEAAGLTVSTLWRQANGKAPLTLQVMDALLTLAMLCGVEIDEARAALFVFDMGAGTARAADKARKLRRAAQRIESAA